MNDIDACTILLAREEAADRNECKDTCLCRDIVSKGNIAYGVVGGINHLLEQNGIGEGKDPPEL